VSGLFFAGASTAPGNGVPLVLISAEQVERKVARHLGV
jgi:phytoene dehydrogenase-like protein